MATAKSDRRPPSPLDFLWLKQQFDEIDKKLNLILAEINNIQTVVSPDLEKEVRRSVALSRNIDLKVPDKQAPPSRL